MKGQISSVVRRLMKKAPTMIRFCLFSSGQRLAVALVLCGLVGIVPYLARTQEQNQIEEALEQAPLIEVINSTLNPLQIALPHWYDANLTTTFGVGRTPIYIACDGANVWVSNFGSNSVTKLRASDGKVLGTFTIGAGPYAVAFDGAHIWVANAGSGTVSKL